MSLTPADFQNLRRYLPQPLVEAVRLDPHNPAPSVLRPCLIHLTELLDTTTRHLPAYLVEQVLRDPTPGKANGRFITGTLLFADISGFTAMSESLSRAGREGAEEVTTIVNRYFGAMLGLMRDQAGQLIKFGGDALLALFLEPDSATRAVQTAVKMQAAMAEFAETKTSQGAFPLRMKVGIRKGRFFAAQLGTTEGMQYALFGHDVNATAAAESAAEAGQVVVDRATHAAITVPTRTAPIPGHNEADTYLLIEDIAPPQASQILPIPEFPIASTVLTLENLQDAVKLLDALTPYLPAGLLARISGLTRTVTMEGEHRLVAVLFANIRGLGDIADRLGPGQEEAITAALNRYFVAMSKPILEYGGVVNKIDLYDHGDKLLTFFGAPVAHEDDAERAVRAALGMQAALNELSVRLPAEAGAPDLTLTQQLGLSYNYVFAGYVGADWQHEYTVMGDEVNLSARLMSVAQPGDVTVSANVRRKVQALFELEPRGSVKVKGKSAAIPIFVVKGTRAIPESTQNLTGMRSKMVGRETEWSRLREVVARWRAGEGQIISIIGEAGLGKSRLAAELRRSLTDDAAEIVRWIEGRCLSYTETVSYYPMREMMRQLVGVLPEDNETEAWAKLRRAPIDATHQPYLANFINLPLDAEAQEKIQYLDAEALQKRTFIAIRSLVEAGGRVNQRLVLALDDLHWMDEASASLLEYLLPLVDSLPVLILLLYRPERDSACWRIRDKAAHDFAARTLEIELARLTTTDSAELLTNLVTLDPWPDRLRSTVLERTEGNPLYLEELLRAFVDGGVLVRDETGWRVGGDLESIQLPDTLEGVMMTRLDRLEEAYRHTTQVASVIGRLFPFEVLSNVVPEVADADLNACLARVQQQEIVRESQRFPELVYMFRHGLMQEVSYGSLLARTRRVYHRKIAAYLESMLEAGGEADTIPLIAHHAFVGQDWPMALRYQSLAGQRAQKLFANQNAIDHFTKALQCAANLLPEDANAGTSAQRLATLVALGELLTTMGQYDRALEYLTQAYTLSETQNDPDVQARACRWLARLHELRGEYPPALEWIQHGLIALDGRETAEGAQMRLIAGLINVRQGNYEAAVEQCQQALQIAQTLHEITALARAYNLLGVVQLRRNGSLAIEYFQQALELYQQAGDLQGQALAHNLIANAEFKTSHWPSADHHYRRARDLFHQIGDVYNEAIADSNLGGIALNQGRLDQALAFHQEALRSMETIGGSLYLLGAVHNNLGATHIRLGAADAARDHLRISREYFERAQARDFLPELLRHLAEAALLVGDGEEAEAQIQQALPLAQELTARGEEGNILRIVGQIAVARQDWPKAEQALRESVAILDEVNEDYEGARSRLALAEYYAASGQASQALATLTQCEPIFERLEAALDLTAARAVRQRLAARA